MVYAINSVLQSFTNIALGSLYNVHSSNGGTYPVITKEAPVTAEELTQEYGIPEEEAQETANDCNEVCIATNEAIQNATLVNSAIETISGAIRDSVLPENSTISFHV